jgi:hypothetical protein
VLQGRPFAPSDRGGERVVVVNSTFVRRYLGSRSPVGLEFLWGSSGDERCRIIGVVAGTKNVTVGEDDEPQLYEALSQIHNERRRLQFVLRSAPPPSLQLAPVGQALRRVEPAAGTEVSTLYSSIGLAFLPSQIGAPLLGSIGVLGLVLAAVGLSGMLAFSVARRVQEIGIRLALGATAGDISWMVVRDALTLVVIGSLLGLLIASFVMRPLALFLVGGLKPLDPISFGAVLVVLGLTGLAASWGAVRRAATVDPIAALRHD